MDYVFYPQGVCPMEMHFHLEGNVVSDLKFLGGCNGNLKAISILLEGKTVEEIEQKLRGNTCGGNDTSCADQFAKALVRALEAEANGQALQEGTV